MHPHTIEMLYNSSYDNLVQQTYDMLQVPTKTSSQVHHRALHERPALNRLCRRMETLKESGPPTNRVSIILPVSDLSGPVFNWHTLHAPEIEVSIVFFFFLRG